MQYGGEPCMRSRGSLCPACESDQFHIARRVGTLVFGHCKQFGLSRVEALSGIETISDSSSITLPDDIAGIKKDFDAQREKAMSVVARRVAEYTKILGRKPVNVLEIGC